MRRKGNDLAIAFLLWPLCFIFVVIAWIIPVDEQAVASDLGAQCCAGTIGNPWIRGLAVAVFVLAIVLFLFTDSVVVVAALWILPIWAIGTGLALNANLWARGGLSAGVLAGLLIGIRLWTWWWFARE